MNKPRAKRGCGPRLKELRFQLNEREADLTHLVVASGCSGTHDKEIADLRLLVKSLQAEIDECVTITP